jgi:DNA (cytosine-5)-methyltransferase 1
MFCGYTVDVPKDGWKSSGIVQNRRPDRYGLAWRVLDAQFTRVSGFPFAVPQRRRRVFLVGCLGDWERAASILLEPDRLQWDTPPRIKTRETSAGGAGKIAYCANGTSYGGREMSDISGPVTTHESGVRGDTKIVFWNGEDVANCITQRVDQNRMPDKDNFHAVISFSSGQAHSGVSEDYSQTLSRDNGGYSYIYDKELRRLLPIECERLMGFPNNHTRIAWNGKPAEECPDAPRYKACGNSFCVNVVEWIGRRIEQYS